MKQKLSRINITRFVWVIILTGIVFFSCGLTTFGAEESSNIPQTLLSPTNTPARQISDPDSGPVLLDNNNTSSSPNAQTAELFPTDVQTIIHDDARQIIKTYILAEEQSPSDISRDSFVRDGWRYTLVDITEKRTNSTDKLNHKETVEM